VNPQLRVLGMTATPYRADRRRMQDVLPHCAFARSVAQMQPAGVLCELRWQQVNLPGVDLSRVPTGPLGREVDDAVGRLRQPGESLPDRHALGISDCLSVRLCCYRPARFGSGASHRWGAGRHATGR
jgi:hypothetical protein